MLKITIKDIAKLAGVSTATVSKIVNNKIDDVSDTTVDKVRKIIKEKNYTPNYLARSMVTKKTKTLGLIIPDIRNPFFTDIAKGAEDRANELGYSIFFCNSDDDLDKEFTYINSLIEKQVDGIMLAGAAKRDKDRERKININIPIISVDRNAYYKGIKGSIEIDNYEGAYEGVKHLISKGYERIVFVSGPLDTKPSKERLRGYKEALIDAGRKIDNENIIVGTYERNFGEKIIETLDYSLENVGFFCGNDLIAIGLIKSLKEKNYKIPEEIGVIGFDDIYISLLISPSLTSVRQPSYKMGYESIELLIKILNNSNEEKNKKTLKTRLIIRESTNRISLDKNKKDK
ncbi:MAG: LacI family DNA-binding transcriptional regulator [Bacillota bacterium]|nr:LacI family DNA-binding transcriptional regulator [Bacillota bacterium]